MFSCAFAEESFNECFEAGLGTLGVSVTETILFWCINVIQDIGENTLIIFSQIEKVLPSLQNCDIRSRFVKHRIISMKTLE